MLFEVTYAFKLFRNNYKLKNCCFSKVIYIVSELFFIQKEWVKYVLKILEDNWTFNAFSVYLVKTNLRFEDKDFRNTVQLVLRNFTGLTETIQS